MSSTSPDITKVKITHPLKNSIILDLNCWCKHCGLTADDPHTLWVSGTSFDGRYNPNDERGCWQLEQTQTEMARMKPMFICRDRNHWVIVNDKNLDRADTVIFAIGDNMIGKPSHPSNATWPQGMMVLRSPPTSFLGGWISKTKASKACLHCGMLPTDERLSVWVTGNLSLARYGGKYCPSDNFTWKRYDETISSNKVSVNEDNEEDQVVMSSDIDQTLSTAKLICDKKTWSWKLVNCFGTLAESERDAKSPADAVWIDQSLSVSRKPSWF